MDNNIDVTFFSPQIPPAWMIRPISKQLANKTFKLDPNDRKNYVLYDGEEDEIDVYYNINSQGYREKEYAENYFEFDRLILAIGHSTVFGYTTRNSHCWPRLLEKSLSNTRVLNFGVPGGSMDSNARMTACLVPYFKSRCRKLEVATLWAQPDRREIFLDNYMCSWTASIEPPFSEYIQTIDDISNRYNHQKNETMIQALCNQYDVPLYTVPWEIYENATKDGNPPTEEHHQQMLLSILEQIK
jgi:lysophospholipase L1-like esterase